MGRGLTLVAVGAGEALVAGAGEVARGLAVALAVGPAHIGGDEPHALVRAVCRHGDRAAVNHYSDGGRGSRKLACTTRPAKFHTGFCLVTHTRTINHTQALEESTPTTTR